MIPFDRSYVLLDARLTAEQALERMQRFKRARWVVVRRVEGALVYWYSFEAVEARQRLTAMPGQSAHIALNLHEYKAQPTHDVSSDGEPPRGDIVLTRSHQLAGVAPGPILKAVAPPAPAPPPATRRRSLGGAPPVPAPPHRGTRARPPEITPAERPTAGRDVGAEAGAGAGAEAPGPMAPFNAWPDLGAPLAVEVGRSFDLTIGFALQQVPGVAGGPVVIEKAPPDFDLDVQVLAVGFDSPKGLRETLHVHRDDPTKSKVAIALVPRALDAGLASAQRVLSVTYSYQGNVCGVATRNVLVALPGAAPNDAVLKDPRSFTAQPPVAPQLRVRPDVPAPDLTVTLMRYDGNVADGNFVWAFQSPHPIALPQPVAKHLGTDAASYARGITSEIVQLGDAPDAGALKLHIEGSARDISDHVPQELWQAISSVAQHAQLHGAPPDVFFITEESCVPWELAWMDTPLDPKSPAFLGAQVNLGRWIVGDPEPPAPPDPAVNVKQMAVMFGDYSAAIGKLPEAIAEKDALVAAYQATPLTMADKNVVLVLLGQKPEGGCEVLHFACHGVGNPQQPGTTSLSMQSGAPFTDNVFRGGALGGKTHPFVFMNACEAGTAGDELDTTSGFVEATLKSGCTGFVGALWEVESVAAQDVALEFYRLTLEQGHGVAAALRQLRSKFATASQDTYLAYVYYGHPSLKLKRA